MISTVYLHEFDVLDLFTESTHHLMNDAYDACRAQNAAEQRIQSMAFLGESVDGYDLVLEETNKNVFAKVGNVVIEVFKAFGEMVGEIIKSLTNSIKGLRKKTADDALKKQIGSDPTMANKFINAVVSGNIKVRDVKDLDALLELARKTSDDLMSGKIDERTFTERIDNGLSKFEQRAKPLQTIIGVGSAALGLYDVIKRITAKSSEYDARAVEARAEMNKLKEDAMNEAKSEAVSSKNGNRLSVWLSGQRKIMTALGREYGVINKVVGKALEFLSEETGKYGVNATNRSSVLTPSKKASTARDSILSRHEDLSENLSKHKNDKTKSSNAASSGSRGNGQRSNSTGSNSRSSGEKNTPGGNENDAT